MSAPSPIGPGEANVLMEWIGLRADAARAAELADVLRAFRERAQRIYAIDVEGVEFDFLRSTDDGHAR